MKKSYWELYPKQFTNNYLKMHGYAMIRKGGKRKRMTKEEWKNRNKLPFK